MRVDDQFRRLVRLVRDRRGARGSVSRLRRVWRGVRWVLLAMFVVLILPSLVGIIGVGFRCGVFAGAPASPPPAPPAPPAPFAPIISSRGDALRPEDQTYLTLPEWYIVYSADEYGAYLAQRPPSGFSYFRAIGQYWGNYYDACAITSQRYTFNRDYHLVLVVIGASFTVENTVRGLYENTFGRVSEWIGGTDTPEDAYAATVARDYGAFLHETPWYLFPFGEKLDGLWNTTPGWGPHIIRKWERRFALSVEYGVKGFYANIIKGGTESTFEPDELTLVAWARGDANTLTGMEGVEVLANEDHDLLLELPRYESFTQLVPSLAGREIAFETVAGNRTIMVTVLAPRAWRYEGADATTLFGRPILSVPDQQRVALELDVSRLDDFVRALPPDVRFEHAYDY